MFLLLLGYALFLVRILLDPGLNHGPCLVEDWIGIGKLSFQEEQHGFAQEEEHPRVISSRHVGKVYTGAQNLHGRVVVFFNHKDVLK